MVELNLKQIIDRLNAEFTGDTRKLVFWYDDKAKLTNTINNTDAKRWLKEMIKSEKDCRRRYYE